MLGDIMTVQEFKTATSHWSQRRKWGHAELRKMDTAISNYHMILKQDIEQRIISLKSLGRICYDYAEDKKLFVWQDTRRQQKISAAEAVYNQAGAQVKYLEEVLKVERLLPAMFGVGRQTPMQQATTNKGRWQALVKQVVAVQEYIGKPSDGRMLDTKYWTEAIDPMHTHWKNPQNHPVFQKWVDLRHNEKTTILPFYRWLETLTDAQLKGLTLGGKGLLHTNYQDEIGREEFRIHIDKHTHTLKYLSTPDTMSNWSSENYSTNFCGNGWCIFVISPEGKLYANSHDQSNGWFHAAFLGGQPVMAAGELYVRNGVIYVMTDKSGHYKPQLQNLRNGAMALRKNGLDISHLQLWARMVDSLTQQPLRGMAGMRNNAIWYQAIDAAVFVHNNNADNSRLHDFGMKTGVLAGMLTATSTRMNKRTYIQMKELGAYCLDKTLLQGNSLDRYGKELK
ncbi:MAG: hypothetical protein methR_P1901 [Methyloprofundus sp.]|nr:MAG: hypothetical protein methR_P1901 [Methyloprofundus sp.]